MQHSSAIDLDRFQADDVAAANDALTQAEARMSGAPRPEPKLEVVPDPPEPQAAPKLDEPANQPDPLPPSTQAAPEPAPGNVTPTPGKNQSAFAKDQERLGRTWNDVNAQKAALKAEREAFNAERIRLQQEQSRFQEQQAKANKNRLTPEVYDQSATNAADKAATNALLIEGLKARKARLEEAGQYTEAAKIDGEIDAKVQEMHVSKYQAEQFKSLAAQMRANPDLSAEQRQQRTNQQLTHYTVEAAKKWPDLAVKDSPFQKAVAQGIRTLRQSGVDENDYPVLRYFVSEHVAAQSAAARVPVLEKELGELRAKVKEYESLTNPGGGRAAVPSQRPSGKPVSLESEGEALRAIAEQMGGRR